MKSDFASLAIYWQICLDLLLLIEAYLDVRSVTCSKDPIHPLFQQSTENNLEGNTTPYKRAKGYIANHPLIVIRRSAFHCHWLANSIISLYPFPLLGCLQFCTIFGIGPFPIAFACSLRTIAATQKARCSLGACVKATSSPLHTKFSKVHTTHPANKQINTTSCLYSFTMMKAGNKRPHPDKRVPEETQPTEMSDNTKDDSTAHDSDEVDTEDAMAEVMQDNLELMLDIIMKIRQDPQFAKSIYADCPRLQHLLDQNPQLRPIFEDPRLVRINFEKAYKDAGGELPEDPKPLLARLVNHPAFKFLKFIVFLKKIMGLMQGGGAAFIKNMFRNMFENFRPSVSADHLHHAAGDIDGEDGNGPDGADDGNPENREARDQLNEAADRFEDPEMKEKLDHLKTIDDPEQLAEEIENDPELRALRDSNELCSELMSDPDTLKIMTEPDNLRALGECPDLIEADMANPEWDPEMDYAETEEADAANAQGDGVEDEIEEEEDEEEEDELEEDEGEEEEEGLEYELGEEEMEERKDSGQNGAKGKGGKAKQNPKSRAQQRKDQRGNFLTNVGVGLSEMIAGEVAGVGTEGLMSGGDELDAFGAMDDYGGAMDEMDALDDADALEDVDELDALEEAADTAMDAADGAAEAAEASDLVEQAEQAAELLTEDDVCDNIDQMNDQLEAAEEAVDENADKAADAATDKKAMAKDGAAAGGIAAAPGADDKAKDGQGKSRSIEDGDAKDEEAPKKKNRFKFMGNFVANVVTSAKENIATSILGDDFGEALVEKMEEEDEDEDASDDESQKSADSKNKKQDKAKGGKGSEQSGSSRSVRGPEAV